MLAIVGMLFATSCSKDEKEETILTLSEKVVTFKSDGEEKSVTVTSNEEWVAEGPTWLELRKEEKKLVLKVAPNKTLEELKGEVKVVAGSLVEIIKVTQQGMEGKATITPENLELGDAEGEVTVKVVANVDSWTAKADVDWLTVTPKPESDELLVKHSKNASAEDRKGVITVTIGKTEKTINVVQSGKMFFIMPYIDFANFSAEAIKKFETERGSQKTKDETGRLEFKTRSEMFAQTWYITAIPNSCYSITTPDLMRENFADFAQFLKSKGFKQTAAGGKNFINEELKVNAQVIILEQIAGVAYKKIESTDNPNNGGDQNDAETFKKFPWISELAWGATEEQVNEYEKANGGTLVEELTKRDLENGKFDALAYKTETKDGTQPHYRFYLIAHDKSGGIKDGLVVKELQYKELGLVYTKVNKNSYVISKKFSAFAKAEGFEAEGMDEEKWDAYTNTGKNTLLFTKPVKFTGEDTPTLRFKLQRADAVNKKASAYSVASYFNVDLQESEEIMGTDVDFPTFIK